MVERMKDEQDRKLEALFRTPAIADDGFSERVARRVRRRVRIRRWTLPIAAAIGGLIALQPALDLLELLPVLANMVPEELKVIPADLLQLPTFFSGLLAAGAMMLAVRLIED